MNYNAQELAQLQLQKQRSLRLIDTGKRAMKQVPANTLATFRGYANGQIIAELANGGTIQSQATSNSGINVGDPIWIGRVTPEYSFARWMPKS